MSARIVVIKDDPDISELVGRYLGKAGYQTERIATGGDALHAIVARPPDLIVLDIMLPQVDGLEIAA